MVNRSQLMVEERPFLVPVVWMTRMKKRPLFRDLFKTVLWTRLPARATPPVFISISAGYSHPGRLRPRQRCERNAVQQLPS